MGSVSLTHDLLRRPPDWGRDAQGSADYWRPGKCPQAQGLRVLGVGSLSHLLCSNGAKTFWKRCSPLASELASESRRTFFFFPLLLEICFDRGAGGGPWLRSPADSGPGSSHRAAVCSGRPGARGGAPERAAGCRAPVGLQMGFEACSDECAHVLCIFKHLCSERESTGKCLFGGGL